MRFVVVEDDADVVKLLITCLRMRWPDAEVESVADGRSAVNLARGWAPDLLILDLGLPADDGVDVLQSIREVSKVPVVILRV